jgi:hypothetical protein
MLKFYDPHTYKCLFGPASKKKKSAKRWWTKELKMSDNRKKSDRRDNSDRRDDDRRKVKIEAGELNRRSGNDNRSESNQRQQVRRSA